MKHKMVAWYLDEDVLLEGIVVEDRFYPDTTLCGFRIQEFDADMVGKKIFFDLNQAISVCGEVPIVKK